jgi:hypothetical protein
VIARVRTDAVRSLRYQHRDLHKSTYHIPLKRSGLIILSGQGIGRSETIKQHEVKPARRDDGHDKVTSGRDHVATI